MRQIALKCPYCLTEGRVDLDSRMRSLINHNQVKEPVSIPCGACVALYENQLPQRPQRNHRFWNWFDRVTRYSLIPKIVIAMTLVTVVVGAVGYKTKLIENHPVTAFIIMILLFCEGIFLLGLLIDIPYDYSYDVVLNPAFKDLEGNAWHKREIGQL